MFVNSQTSKIATAFISLRVNYRVIFYACSLVNYVNYGVYF